MADPLQIQQNLRQQRQSIEAQRRQLTSQRNIRQATNRNQLLQRQQQLQRLGQQDRALQSQLSQLEQAEPIQAVSREQLRQEALATLVRTGKANDAFRSLTKQEQSQVQDEANEIERLGARQRALSQVVNIESQLGQRLDPVTREQLVKETIQTGRATLSINTLGNSSLGSGFQGPVPKGFDQATFTATGQLTPIRPTTDTRFQGPVPRFTDPEFFAQTGKKRQLPLVVSAARTFQTEFRDLRSDVSRRFNQGDLPGAVRETISTGSSLFFREGVRRTEAGLRNVGVGEDSPLFKPTQIPVSKIIGDVALGSLLVGLSGTSQIGVSRYVKNGIVYEIDSAGNVIASRPLSQVRSEASTNIADFRQSLRESSTFKKANTFYPNEANLRMKTRELIQKSSTNPKLLKQLKDLYRKEGRVDLYNDIFEQEIGQIARTNSFSRSASQTKSIQATKDKPGQLVGAGQITSQATSIDTVIANPAPRPPQQTTLPGLAQTGFQFENLSLPSRQRFLTTTLIAQSSKNQQAQINSLGLKTETQTKQSNIQARALLSGFRTAQATRQQSRQLTQQVNQLGLRNRGRQTPKPLRVRFGFDLPEDSTSRFRLTRGTDSSTFGIEVRRFGKFQSIGSESSLANALRRGARTVDVNLGRSFRLRDLGTGELLDVRELPIGFRRSKRERNVFVEESKFALSTGSEKGEIKYFKNVKGKSKRSLI